MRNWSMSKANRKHQRYPLFSVAELQVKNSADPPSTVLVQNISESGIGLYAYSPIEKGTPIAILVKFTTIDGTRAADTVQYVSNIFKYYIAYRMLIEQTAMKEKARGSMQR